MANDNFKWIALIVVVAVIFYAGNAGWFKSSFLSSTVNYNQQIPLTPSENISKTYTVNLDIEPNNICIGDQTQGKLSSNMPNALCSIYFKDASNTWKLYKNVALDSNGAYKETMTINTAGSALFRSVCYLNNNYAISNDDTLIVTNCNNPQPPAPLCVDSDNGQVKNVFGTCESAITQTGNHDTCEQVNVVKEWYCKADNTCDFVYKQCDTGWWCVQGQCMQPQCDLIHPAVAMDCAVGLCNSGACEFIPATLTTPAKCGCS